MSCLVEYPQQFTDHNVIRTIFFGFSVEQLQDAKIDVWKTRKVASSPSHGGLSISNIPKDDSEERFAKLEAQVSEISKRMVVLIAEL